MIITEDSNAEQFDINNLHLTEDQLSNILEVFAKSGQTFFEKYNDLSESEQRILDVLQQDMKYQFKDLAFQTMGIMNDIANNVKALSDYQQLLSGPKYAIEYNFEFNYSQPVSHNNARSYIKEYFDILSNIPRLDIRDLHWEGYEINNKDENNQIATLTVKMRDSSGDRFLSSLPNVADYPDWQENESKNFIPDVSIDDFSVVIDAQDNPENKGVYTQCTVSSTMKKVAILNS